MLSRLLDTIDHWLSYRSLFKRDKGLMILMFHSVFLDRDEKYSGVIDPGLGVTVDEFERIIIFLKENGYQFVSLGGAEQDDYDKLSVCITFDDGYANNRLVVPIIKKYEVPIIIFPSIRNVERSEAFWWDLFYRDKIYDYSTAKRLRTLDIRKQIVSCEKLRPIGEIDRPLTIAELKLLAEEPLIEIGNHTCDHAILTNYTDDEVQEEIAGAQSVIEKWVGYMPKVIAYPNGNCSRSIVDVAKDNNIKCAVTVSVPKVNSSWDNKYSLYRIGVSGEKDIERQLSIANSKISLKRIAIYLYLMFDSNFRSCS